MSSKPPRPNPALSPSHRRLLIGVVHLLPLPGAPTPGPSLSAVLARAVEDTRALATGGADGFIIENFGDIPFSGEAAEPWVVAAMTRIALAAREAAPNLLCGINVLRNDARSAVAIAVAAEAHFVRVNVHVGAMLTDQGPIVGKARETLLDRKRLGAEHIAIAADVAVKHAVPLAPADLADLADDTWNRGLADVLIVTGKATGHEANVDDVAKIAARLPNAPLWVGSGVRFDRTQALVHAHGAIVGSSLHTSGDLRMPLDTARIAQLRSAMDQLEVIQRTERVFFV